MNDGRAGILDNNGQYSIFLLEDGRIDCNGSGGVTSIAAIEIGVWTHVACTWGDNGSRGVYVDGALLGLAGQGALQVDGMDDIEIGSDGAPRHR